MIRGGMTQHASQKQDQGQQNIETAGHKWFSNDRKPAIWNHDIAH